MSNKEDFTISLKCFHSAIQCAVKANSTYSDSIAEVRRASKNMYDTSHWKGKARDEWKDAFVILDHYLENDADLIAAMGETLKSLQEIYEKVDAEAAKILNKDS